MEVARYEFKNCTVHIMDDCFVGEEEKEKILKEMGEMLGKFLSKKQPLMNEDDV